MNGGCYISRLITPFIMKDVTSSDAFFSLYLKVKLTLPPRGYF